MNPTLVIDLDIFRYNAETMAKRLKDKGIAMAAVTKCFAADPVIVDTLSGTGIAQLADSRLKNFAHYPSWEKPRLLLRAPAPDDAAATVAACDISMNSERATIEALGEAAGANGKPHGILIMVDMGDLREGIYHTDRAALRQLAAFVAGHPHLTLEGLGVNLTCYGSIIPDVDILTRFAAVAEDLENTLGVKLPILSGGNSSTVYLLEENQPLPPRINHLRLGEAVIIGNETAYSKPIAGLKRGAVTLKASVIEVLTKPSYPEGKMGVNAFGEVGTYVDRGNRKKALLAVGRQDIDHEALTPFDAGVEILGASSDHLILDIEDAENSYKPGDVMQFYTGYAAALRGFTSAYVEREYIGR
ncbi:alanine/ornithine racemase family PLP-dependent enzyme [Ruminococcaceae bacterium OttesenSCG-928-A11]|nr:alanine/ornithine racemase family PLP-dependent enzyme [Ruminococcaceae bacterium OttesenSCG-928-A11]